MPLGCSAFFMKKASPAIVLEGSLASAKTEKDVVGLIKAQTGAFVVDIKSTAFKKLFAKAAKARASGGHPLEACSYTLGVPPAEPQDDRRRRPDIVLQSGPHRQERGDDEFAPRNLYAFLSQLLQRH